MELGASKIVEALLTWFGCVEGKLAPQMVMTEVANGTGTGRTQRYADVVAVGMWPSRGLTITGVEIKVSTSDWRRELKNAAKADQFSWCDRWYVASPPDVIPPDEVPEKWGQLELRKGKIKVLKKAPQMAEREVDRQHWIALLRRAQDVKNNPLLKREVDKLTELAHERGRLLSDDEKLLRRISNLEHDLASAKREGDRMKKELESVADFEREFNVLIRRTNWKARQEARDAFHLIRVLNQRGPGWVERRNRMRETESLAREAERAARSLLKDASRVRAGMQVLLEGVDDDVLQLVSPVEEPAETEDGR